MTIHVQGWTNGVTTDGFRDYTLRLPDVNGHGGLLRLSFSLGEATAYLCIRLDNEDCDEFLDNEAAGGTEVPLAWANAIASGVDGYTMTPARQDLA